MTILAILVVIAGIAGGTGLSRAACLTVPSSQILARDLAATIPAFRALDPETLIGFAPFPGTVRVLSSHDVVLIGHRFGLVYPPGEAAPSACVERMVRHLSEAEMMTALRAALDCGRPALIHLRLDADVITSRTTLAAIRASALQKGR